MEVEVTVCRRAWRTIRDAPDKHRVRHFARLVFPGGLLETRTVRLSAVQADHLLELGAKLDEDSILSQS